MRPLLARSVAALVSLALLTSGPAAFAQPQNPDPAKIEEAKKHMAAGAAFYNDPSGHKCEEAYREFKRAYELSGSANALKGMAVCALELERDGEAIAHYEAFLKLKGDKIDSADKQQVDKDLTALRAAVAWVVIKTDRANVRLTDVRTPTKGFPVRNQYTLQKGATKLGIHPGQHTFTASVDGAPEQTWTVEIANGGSYERTFQFDQGKPEVAAAAVPAPAPTTEPKSEPAPEPPPEEPSSGKKSGFAYAALATGGLTVALAVPTVIFMVGAKDKKSEFDAANGKSSQSELETLRSDVVSANTTADIFLGVTAASLIATGVLATLYFASGGEPSPAETGRASWSVAPVVGQNAGGAVVVGRF